MKSRLFLDVVIAQGTAIFQLLSGEDKTLLVRRDAFFVLDLCLHIFNGVAWFDLQSDGLSRQGFDKNLHSTSQTKNKVKCWLFLDVVVA